jgi:hypothetical protein
MIRDSRPKRSRDLDHVLHFAKRFESRGKQVLRTLLTEPAKEDCPDGASCGQEENEEQVSKIAN